MSNILKALNESRSDWDSNMPDWQKREQDMMDYSKREFKRREMEHELGHEDEQERREQSQNWYIRINGKILKDKNKQPYTFRGKAAANKAALTMMNKDFNKGKKFTLTTSWMDAPAITESVEGTTYMQVKSLVDKMDKGGKKRIAGALRKSLGIISESKEQVQQTLAQLQHQQDNLEVFVNKAREITKSIKYDDVPSSILVQIQQLAAKSGISESELRYAENEVREAQHALESAIYGLEEVFTDKLREVQNQVEDLEYELEYGNDELDEGQGYEQYRVDMIDRNGKLQGVYHKDNTHYNLENMLSDIKGYQRSNPRHTFQFYINGKPVDWKELVAKQGVAEGSEESQLQPGTQVMLWLGPRDMLPNPPRDDKQYWDKGVVVSEPEMMTGSWQVLVKSERKGQSPISPERVFILRQQSVAEGSDEDSYSNKFVQSQIDYYTKHGLSGTAADRERINGSLNYYQHIKNKRIKDGTWQEQGVAEGEHDAEFIDHEDSFYNMVDFAHREMRKGKSLDDIVRYLVDNNYLGFMEVSTFYKQMRGEKWNESVEEADSKHPGLWANIHAKRERIKHGSHEHMRKPGSKGAPTAQAFKDSAKTSKNESSIMSGVKNVSR